MKAPSPIFELTYAADRRNHKHRCRCCWRIVQPGERVLMAKVPSSSVVSGAHVTQVLHLACADLAIPTPPWTWRDALRDLGVQYLRNAGWKNLQTDPRGKLRGRWKCLDDGTFIPDLTDEIEEGLNVDQLDAQMRADYARAMEELAGRPPFADLISTEAQSAPCCSLTTKDSP